MTRYSEEFKETTVQKMMAPNAMSIAQIHRETGVSEPTLYNWRNRARNRGKAVPSDPSNPEQWDGKSKLAVVVETAAFNGHELSEYCRRKGLYVEQIERWREGAIAGTDTSGALLSAERRDLRKQKGKVRELEKELRRKEKALAETAALLVLEKKVQVYLGGARGRMIVSEDRKMILDLVEEAVESGAREEPACAVLRVSTRTLRRWRCQRIKEADLTDRRPAAGLLRTPSNTLTEAERNAILAVCNRPEYQSIPPSQIVPRLADKGQYIGSESSFYRVLRAAEQIQRRGRAHAPRTVEKPKGYKADGPNQVWSWDITYFTLIDSWRVLLSLPHRRYL